MITYDYPPLVEQDMVPKFIDEGTYGQIYEVSRFADLVVKVPFYDPGLECLVREYSIAQALFDRGISVPKPK